MLIHGCHGEPPDLQEPLWHPSGTLWDTPWGGPGGVGSCRKHVTCIAKAQNFAMQKTKLCNATNTTLHCNEKLCVAKHCILSPKTLQCNKKNVAMQETQPPKVAFYQVNAPPGRRFAVQQKKRCIAIKKTLHCNVWFLRPSFRVEIMFCGIISCKTNTSSGSHIAHSSHSWPCSGRGLGGFLEAGSTTYDVFCIFCRPPFS